MTEYTMRLTAGHESELRVSARHLQEWLGALVEGARASARFAIEGESTRQGPRPAWLDKACDLAITGLAPGSVVVGVEAPALGNVHKEKVSDRLSDSAFLNGDEQLSERTAVDLLIRQLETMQGKVPGLVDADRSLVDTCLKFAKVSVEAFGGIEIRELSGNSSITVRSGDLTKIQNVCDEIPVPRFAQIIGDLDTISASTTNIVVLIEGGERIAGRLSEQDPELLKRLFHKSVTVTGTANYGAHGKLRFIQVDEIREADEGDKVFMPGSNDLFRHPTNSANPRNSRVDAFIDKWVEEDTDEEVEAMLRKYG